MRVDHRQANKLEAKVKLPDGAQCHCGLNLIPRWKPTPPTERVRTGHVNIERQTAHFDYACPSGHVTRIEYPPTR